MTSRWRSKKVMRAIVPIWRFALLFISTSAIAGPPFVTDDPEPVELHHWEIYLASQTLREADAWSGTAPHFEVNYGALPNLQLHVIAPFAFNAPSGGPTQYGYGDTELGAKYRFIQETEGRPQVGTFVLVEVPTGNSNSGLGNGLTQILLPIWLQKSFGAWTSYGGGGYWINPGSGNQNWLFLGDVLQRRLSNFITLGGELFYSTPKQLNADSEVRFNLGGVMDVSDHHHVLLSLGRGLKGPDLFQSYVAYQLTL